MSKTNRTCFFCGNSYYYCPTCPGDLNKPSWYALWCSEQCKSLDNIVAAHRSGKITTEKAKNKIKELNINIKDLKFARETLKEYFNMIMSYKSEVINENKSDKDLKKESIEETKNIKTKVRRTKIVSKSKIEKNNKEDLKENLDE